MARETKSPRDKKKGNVWLGKDEKWHWEVVLTRRDGTAFRKHGSRKTEKQALASRDTAFEEFNRNEGANDQGWTIQSWGEHCLEQIWPNELKGTTLDNYRHWLTTQIFKPLGRIRIDEITVPQLQVFFNKLRKDKTEKTAVRVKTALASSLSRAMRQGFITTNPCRAVKISTTTGIQDELDVTKRILSADEMKKLARVGEGTSMFWPVLLGTRFGLRFGECLGLKWKHVDVDRKVIRIRQQVQQIRGQGLSEVSPKTKSGNRNVPIPSDLLSLFVEGKAVSRTTGVEWVCHREGRPYSAQNGSVLIKRFVIEAGFDGSDGQPVPTHHDFRSSFLTYLANHSNGGQGVKPHVLMKLAGHSKLQTTMQYYITATEDDVREAMELMS